MATVYARIKAAIEAAADIASDLLETVQLGTAGSQVEYPSSLPIDANVAQPMDTGQMWNGVFLPPVLTQIGVELDRSVPLWARISTNATGVAPTLVGDTGVASVSKNEGADELTVTFDTVYGAATYYTAARPVGSICIPFIVQALAGSVTFDFRDRVTGLPIDINNRDILFFASGPG